MEIQQAVSYMQITDFNQLVTKCRIFEDKMKERQARGFGGPQRSHPFRGHSNKRMKPYSSNKVKQPMATSNMSQSKGTGYSAFSAEDRILGEIAHNSSRHRKIVAIFVAR